MDIRRRIIHLDFDTLYVSLERAVNPHLRGRPVVVGGRAEEHGIVAGLSREARDAGIYPAMPVARARTICPDLVVLPGDHTLYHDRARTVWHYLQRYSPVWERASLDRIFLDMTGTATLFGDAVDVGVNLSRELRNRYALDSTIGVATNKLVSRVASDSVLSGGMCDVQPGSESHFLAPLPVGRLPGVGMTTERRLADFNIHLIHDLAIAGTDFLVTAFGRYGQILYANAQGLDDSPVGTAPKPTAVICAESLPHNTNDTDLLSQTLRRLVEEAGFRLRRDDLWAQRVAVEIGFVDGVKRQESSALHPATDLDNEIMPVADRLLNHLLERRLAVRRVAVRLSRLSHAIRQLALIETERNYDRRRSLQTAVDRVRNAFGTHALTRGDTMTNAQKLIR
ncbi:MAG TPA: DNA polymerase IV [Acidobacteriota bacterium]|nr:DNA polymerase IV [Acidobacteriota bacterium]